MTASVKLPVDTNPGLWPRFYREALRHPVVQLAFEYEPQVVIEPETWLRTLGYDLAHRFGPVDDLADGTFALDAADIRRGAYVRSFRTSYWQVVAAHVWAPWLDERGWTPSCPRDEIHPHAAVPEDPNWISPSGGIYHLWRHLVKAEECKITYNGIALVRDGTNPATVIERAVAARRRGASARMRRWIDLFEAPTLPPEYTPALEAAVCRAWPRSVVLPARWRPAEASA